MSKIDQLTTNLMSALEVAETLGLDSTDDGVSLVEEAAIDALVEAESSDINELSRKLDALHYVATVAFADVPQQVIQLIESIRQDAVSLSRRESRADH